jgi:hypothetical protein
MVGSGNGVACQGDFKSTLRVRCITSSAAKFLGCDVEEFRSGGRGSPQRLLERDLLLYLVRQMGGFNRSPTRCNVRVGLLGGEPESRDLQSQTSGEQGLAAKIRENKINNQDVTL